ncbi:MAG: MerR family transcriptional regulator [Desulfovibrio sp.]|jgi:DNA-binding transcriptional MerR regulator|nr:MerR family transcriptional regulator [Desulfovibrio sp.]
MKIGELAKITGCKIVTIRYYEKEGLLTEPERTKAGYRLYGKEDLERLEFVLHCRRHGITRSGVKKLLAFRDKPQPDCSWITALFDAHVANADEQIRSLEKLKRHLEKLRNRCVSGDSGATCGIMQGLNNQELCCACDRARIF